MVADRDHRATGASAQQIARDDDERNRPDQTEIIDPPVGVEGQAERRPWRVDLDTLDPAGPVSSGGTTYTHLNSAAIDDMLMICHYTPQYS